MTVLKRRMLLLWLSMAILKRMTVLEPRMLLVLWQFSNEECYFSVWLQSTQSHRAWTIITLWSLQSKEIAHLVEFCSEVTNPEKISQCYHDTNCTRLCPGMTTLLHAETECLAVSWHDTTLFHAGRNSVTVLRAAVSWNGTLELCSTRPAETEKVVLRSVLT